MRPNMFAKASPEVGEARLVFVIGISPDRDSFPFLFVRRLDRNDLIMCSCLLKTIGYPVVMRTPGFSRAKWQVVKTGSGLPDLKFST